MKKINTRKMQTFDIEFCAEILKNNYENYPFYATFEGENHIKYIENKFENSENTCFVIENNNEIISFALFSLSYWINGLQAILEEINIKSEYQGEGIGKELYNYTENVLKRNVSLITCFIDKERLMSILI